MAIWTLNRVDPAEDEPLFIRRAKSQLRSENVEVRIDFGEVETLCSGDLNDLIALNGNLRASGRQLVLVNVPKALLEILEFTRLDRLFRIDPQPGTTLIS